MRHSKTNGSVTCAVCNKNFPAHELVSGARLHDTAATEIRHHPDWTEASQTCHNEDQVNLKAELEFRHLHEKMDVLLSHQWERMIGIKEVQLEQLNELRRPHAPQPKSKHESRTF